MRDLQFILPPISMEKWNQLKAAIPKAMSHCPYGFDHEVPCLPCLDDVRRVTMDSHSEEEIGLAIANRWNRAAK